jgi:Prohead core protein serine protease
MKLIQELNESVELLTEDVGGKKTHHIHGIFLQSEIKNRNGRIYPEATMDKEVNRYIKEKVDKNQAFGELTHPNSPTLNLQNVSHLITSLVKEGTNWVGKAKILDTPMGNIAKGILDGGGRLGVSSRALGSLKMNNEGVNIVQPDFFLSTAADLVSDPSGPDCWVNGIMENKEWVYVDGVYIERYIEEAKKEIRMAKFGKIEEAKLHAFQNFLAKIK